MSYTYSDSGENGQKHSLDYSHHYLSYSFSTTYIYVQLKLLDMKNRIYVLYNGVVITLEQYKEMIAERQ